MIKYDEYGKLEAKLLNEDGVLSKKRIKQENYKMYKKGLKVLTTFDTGIVHLDAGSTIGQNPERSAKLIFSEYRNKLIFWHRFIYLPEKSWALKIWSIMAILYSYGVQFFKHSVFYFLGKKSEAKSFWSGCLSGLDYIKSEEYKKLPRI